MSIFNSPQSEQDAKDLFLVASNSISALIESYKPLSKQGLCEAMMFNTNLVLGKGAPNPVMQRDWEHIEDGYFTLLIYMIQQQRPDKSEEELVSLINERLQFYTDEYNKLMSESTYTPMWVYSTFYLGPLQDEPIASVDILEILSFQMGLYKMISEVEKNYKKRFLPF